VQPLSRRPNRLRPDARDRPLDGRGADVPAALPWPAGASLGKSKYQEELHVIGRGITLKRFKNKNGHMILEPDTLRDINKALAEFYGEVLPDTTDEKPTKKQASTAVSKDLQYYPTPAKVAERVMIREDCYG